MPHLLPLIIPSGHNIQGESLGFHAYSLRVDNLTNQWIQEQSTLAWVPPYSLGVIMRLWGTGVAQLLSLAPFNQPQLVPIAGEYATAVYSDVFRPEVAPAAVRQFALVQAVSDLTQGAEPAFPPVGVDRLWADPSGLIHHLHSNGVDTILTDPLQTGVVTSAMILDSTIQTADIAANAVNGAAATYGPAIPTFSTNTTAIWVATPITATLTCTGFVVRVAGYFTWAHTAAAGAAQWALYIDGAAVATLGIAHDALASGDVMFGFDILLTPAAGAHTFTIYTYNFSAGTLSLANSVNSFLGVMEHKR